MSEMALMALFRGGAFIPFKRHANYISANLSDGDKVYLLVQHERSAKTHRHQFAWLSDAFDSMPDRFTGAPFMASPDALRKHALIATGFCETVTVSAGSNAAAHRVAPAMADLARKAHGYAIVEVSGQLVTCKTPLSQSMRAMGKDTFQKSKDAILNYVAGLLEVEPQELEGMADVPQH